MISRVVFCGFHNPLPLGDSDLIIANHDTDAKDSAWQSDAATNAVDDLQHDCGRRLSHECIIHGGCSEHRVFWDLSLHMQPVEIANQENLIAINGDIRSCRN